MSSHAGTIDHHHDPSTSTGIPNKKLVMWAFLASDCMFFGSLIATHLIYRLHPPAGNPEPQKVFNPALTSFSTFILLMSSLMMALAVNAIQKGNVKSTRRSLLATIFCGSIFLLCQVYEFNEFVSEKHVTITNSIFGSTFFTLTGTHGTHVAIGVLWLTLMYIRSFQPGPGKKHSGLLIKNVAHMALFAGVIVMSMMTILGIVHGLQEAKWHVGDFPGSAFMSTHTIPLFGAIACYIGLFFMAKDHGVPDFDQTNAIDVESMGLYWHFVDIVWIVIFTAVYLLEYLTTK